MAVTVSADAVTKQETVSTQTISTVTPAETVEGGDHNGPRAAADEAALILYATISRLPHGDPRRAAARDEMIRAARPFALRLAARYRGRGEQADDLAQVAMVGLIKAVDGYDPELGHFCNYAGPTVTGEIKRHFRDRGWSIRVPRRLQDLRQDISRANQQLTHDLHRSPTVSDLAGHLKISQEEVIEGLCSAQAYSAASLDAPIGSEEDGRDLGSMLGAVDPAMEGVDDHLTLPAILASLPEREQRILTMRFYGNLTQSQIAEAVGVSQMHVSRLLSRALTQLRAAMAAEGPSPVATKVCAGEGLPQISTVGRPGGVSAVVVVGEIDRDHAPMLRSALCTAALAHRPLEVHADLTDVPLLDAAGVAAIAAGCQAARHVGVHFKVIGARRMVSRVLAASGLADLVSAG